VTNWLKENSWKVVTSEIGYVAKTFPELSDQQRSEAGEFLQALEEHDDVHRVWTAIR
jgi:transcriptional/translational regulatory protein YebC/TACO1